VLTEIYSKALYNINTQRDDFIQKENFMFFWAEPIHLETS
jgi:hypothetical protein